MNCIGLRIHKETHMLLSYFQENGTEVGCDEAGRGCLAGPVFAAAVIFDRNYTHENLNDSKQLTVTKRQALRKLIESEAVEYAVSWVDASEIDQINIHQASYMAMHRAIDQLQSRPDFLLIDGKHFIPYREVAHQCVIKGDGKYLSIAAASILAKTYRDEYMEQIAAEHPQYGWAQNKGYPTTAHRIAVLEHGPSPYHRLSFRVTDPRQMAQAAPNINIIEAMSEIVSPI